MRPQSLSGKVIDQLHICPACVWEGQMYQLESMNCTIDGKEWLKCPKCGETAFIEEPTQSPTSSEGRFAGASLTSLKVMLSSLSDLVNSVKNTDCPTTNDYFELVGQIKGILK